MPDIAAPTRANLFTAPAEFLFQDASRAAGSGAVWFSCGAIYLSRPAMDDQSSPQVNNIINPAVAV
jgi:hypothetical protein